MGSKADRKPKEPKPKEPTSLSPSQKKEKLKADIRLRFQKAFGYEDLPKDNNK